MNNKIISGYGEFLVKHTVKGCSNRNEIKSNFKENKTRFPNISDSYGGSEANVLMDLSCLGVATRYASCFNPKSSCSKEALNVITNLGVDTSFVGFNNKHIGEYYFIDNDELKRDEKTKFYREGSCINFWDLSTFDFDKFFEGVSIFHLSGISLSLDGEKDGVSYKNANRFLQEAKSRGVTVTFDFNYRPSMWEDKIRKKEKISLLECKEKAKSVFKKNLEDLLDKIDVFLLSPIDLITFLDCSLFENEFDPLINNSLLDEIQKWFFNKYSSSKMLVIRDRRKPSPTYNWMKSYIITREEIEKTEHRIFFPVVEPIGGGDSFDAGILYGILNNGFTNLSNTLSFANELFVIKHQCKGDYFNINNLDLLNRINSLHENRKKINILLMVDKIDEHFLNMKNDLSFYCNVNLEDKSVDSLEGYDILIGKRLNEELLSTNNKLKAVFAYKTGVDDFPLEKLNELGISLYNSHIDANIIAKYAFALATTLSCRISEFDNKMRRGVWYDYDRPYWKTIEDMRIGLLGFGNIGKNINALLVRNNIQTYTIKRHDDLSIYKDVSITFNDKEILSLDDLIQASDMIIISLPKTKDTNNMFNERTFSLMKGKYLVNVGRGNCIDEKALYSALKNNILYGAAIDTWKNKSRVNGAYPCSEETPLWELDNIIMSPHQAMKIDIGHERYILDATENILSFLLNGYERDKVNLKKGY